MNHSWANTLLLDRSIKIYNVSYLGALSARSAFAQLWGELLSKCINNLTFRYYNLQCKTCIVIFSLTILRYNNNERLNYLCIFIKNSPYYIHQININYENKISNKETDIIIPQSDNNNIKIMEIDNENDEANNVLIFAPNKKKSDTYKKIIDGPNEINRYDPIDKCAESHEQFFMYIGISDDGDC